MIGAIRDQCHSGRPQGWRLPIRPSARCGGRNKLAHTPRASADAFLENGNSKNLYFNILYYILIYFITFYYTLSSPCANSSLAQSAGQIALSTASQHHSFDVAGWERNRILKAANQYLGEAPITMTAATSPRSAGGPHDFFSEADYWWPDPNNPSGPYVQRDGMSNPDNFVERRRYLMRMSIQVPALAVAWKLTRNRRDA